MNTTFLTAPVGRAMASRTRIGLVALASLMSAMALLAGCKGELPSTKRTNYVVLGDSLSAGHQNGCTVYYQQTQGYAYVIARQAGWRLDPPLISAPGARPCMVIGQDYNLLSVGRQPVDDPDTGLPGAGDPNDPRTWGTRLNPALRSGNLSSPGTRIVDVFSAPPAAWGTPPPDGYHWMFGLDYLAMWSLFADTPDRTPDMSLLDQALERIAARPTERSVVVMWLGSNDALWSALGGVADAVTPLASFQAAYDGALSALAASGADVVVANIPDLTVAPHFMPAETAVGLFPIDPAQPELGFLTLDTVIAPGVTVGMLLGLDAADYVVNSTGLPEIYAILAGLKPGPLPDDLATYGLDVVLHPAEVDSIRQQMAAFNAHIQDRAATFGAVYVDVAGLLDSAHASGYPLGKETLGTGYCEGIFSLDGVHPSDAGYAIVANAFIRAMNDGLGLRIPLANETAARASEAPKNLCRTS